MKKIVLDKCYLQGASKKDVNILCDKYCVLMIDTLFMELISDNPVDRAKCFRKIPGNPHSVTLFPSVSNLLQFEIENGRPCSPIIDHRYKGIFQINPRMGDPDFVLTAEDRESMESWESEICNGLNDFREESILVDGFFPELKGLRPGSNNELIKRIIGDISSDSDIIRDIYGAIRKETFPLKNEINEHWAFFRWVQVHLIDAVEYYYRYGTISNPKTHSIMNGNLDLDYCIIGSLADGIASNDNGLTKRYRYLCPNKIIISSHLTTG